MEYKKIKNDFVIRLDKGDELGGSIKKLILKENTYGGFFYGIGAVDEIELAHYDVSEKKYSSKLFRNPYEMTSVVGSVGYELVNSKKELIVHMHGNFSDKNMKVLGGHIVSARISGTAEIYLVKLSSLGKKYDKGTGLKLFDF